MSILLLVSVLAAARLILPFEIPVTHAIRSWNVLGAALSFFHAHPVFTQFLLVAWGIGAVIVVGKDIYDLHRARRRCLSYRIVESESVQEIAKRLSIICPVRVSPDVNVPYVAGIFRHTIYLPVLNFSEKKTELVLAHEAQHIRTHDALIKLFFGLVSAVMWWNLITLWFRREIDALLEFRCDAKVTEHMNKADRKAYLQMLLDVAALVAAPGRVPALALDESSAAGKTNVLEQRFEVILGETGKPLWPRFLKGAVQCVLVAAFCASYLVIVQPAILAPAEDFQNDSESYYLENFDGPIIDENTNGAFIVKGSDGRYQLFINYSFSRYLSDGEISLDEYKNLYVLEEARQK